MGPLDFSIQIWSETNAGVHTFKGITQMVLLWGGQQKGLEPLASLR